MLPGAIFCTNLSSLVACIQPTYASCHCWLHTLVLKFRLKRREVTHDFPASKKFFFWNATTQPISNGECSLENWSKHRAHMCTFNIFLLQNRAGGSAWVRKSLCFRLKKPSVVADSTWNRWKFVADKTYLLFSLEPKPSSPPDLWPSGSRHGGDEGLGSRLTSLTCSFTVSQKWLSARATRENK